MQIILWIIVSLILIGFLYEQYARYKAKSYKIEGAFVDVGGHKLHYLKKGNAEATIIFESGTDFGGHIVWRNIQEKLSKKFTTLSYDRAGTLHSERGENPKTCTAMAEELHTLIEKLELPKPYIFVGHSLAGLTLRCFMNKYSKNVVGMVLLDPMDPSVLDNISKNMYRKYTFFFPKWLVSFLLPLGIIRVMYTKFIDIFSINALPSERKNIQEALDFIHKGFYGFGEEYRNVKMLSKDSKGMRFGDIPLIIVGASKSPFEKEEYYEALDVIKNLHLKTVQDSKNAKYIDVDSAHVIQFEKPDFVVETVENFAEEILENQTQE